MSVIKAKSFSITGRVTGRVYINVEGNFSAVTGGGNFSVMLDLTQDIDPRRVVLRLDEHVLGKMIYDSLSYSGEVEGAPHRCRLWARYILRSLQPQINEEFDKQIGW